jgi:hypothetical protein
MSILAKDGKVIHDDSCLRDVIVQLAIVEFGCTSGRYISGLGQYLRVVAFHFGSKVDRFEICILVGA